MKILKKSLLIPGVLLCGMAAQAGLHYIDATDGAAGNTTYADGSTLLANDGTGGTTWRQRDDAAFGANATVFEGVDPSEEIKTTITGLTPGLQYNIYVHYWDPAEDTVQAWNVQAGLTSGDLTLFSHLGENEVSGSAAGIKAGTLTYDVAPDAFGPFSEREMFVGYVGMATADGSGNIAVFIDDNGSADVDLRTWYDGVSYEAVSGPTHAATLSLDGGWCWFSDPRALFHNDQLYFGYVESTGKTALDVFDPSNGEATKLWVSSYTQVDDHNVPGLVSKDDGTMLAVYAGHFLNNLFYRTSTSTNPVTPQDWTAEQVLPNNTSDQITYNNPFQLSSEGGKIYNFTRNISWDPTIYTSTDGGSSWSAAQQFIDRPGSGGSERPYVKYCSDGESRIDVLYTDGHPRGVANSLYHMYFDDGGFYATDASLIKSYASLPIDYSNPAERGSTIYQYSDTPTADFDDHIASARAWCWEIAQDTNGHPVCVFQVQLGTDGAGYGASRIFYYYARWTGSQWQKKFIAQAGRGLYSAESDYAGGITVDPQDPNIIYLSTNARDPFDLSSVTDVPLGDHYEIWKGVTSDGGLTFSWTPITSNSSEENLRPYVPRRNGGEACILWYQGSYNTYTSYSGSLVGLFTTDVPVPLAPPPAPPITYVDASSGPSGNTTEWGGAAWATFNPPFNTDSAIDNQWEEETGSSWGNGPTENWFEANREPWGNSEGEDCPQLRTSVSGLPHAVYNVYAYFWVANGQGYVFGAAATNNPAGSLPLYAVGSPGVTHANAGDFDHAVSVTSLDRSLQQVSLGTVTGTTVQVYIDDMAGGGYNNSTWYDGVGYRIQLATTPADIALAVSNDTVNVAWPESHKGWMLQFKPSLSNDWSDVGGSTTGNLWNIPSANVQDSEFFRIRYPLP